jgi:hypothetical protein
MGGLWTGEGGVVVGLAFVLVGPTKDGLPL